MDHHHLGVKNWPNLPTDSTKKLPMVGGRGQKFVKICRRLKRMVPKVIYLHCTVSHISRLHKKKEIIFDECNFSSFENYGPLFM